MQPVSAKKLAQKYKSRSPSGCGLADRLFVQQCVSGLVDIACADSQDQIALPRIFAQPLRQLRQRGAVDAARNGVHQILRGHADGVLLTGGVKDIADADRLIGEGKADLIGVGRALLKDPEWADRAFA